MTTEFSFSEPLSRAWKRMTDALFRPFSIKKWFVLGFTAWLAGLASGGGGGGSSAGPSSGDKSNGDGLANLWETVVGNSLWITLVALGCVILIALVVAALWVSSRGKFMFLDNVVFNRALVVDPWKRFRMQGNSLFFFRILFFLGCIILIGSTGLAIAGTVGFSFWDKVDTTASIAIVALAISSFVALILAIFYAIFFLDAFVVPLMHRYGLGVLDGWRQFFDLLRHNALAFILCGLLALVLGVGVVILVFTFGCMTCCLGFLLLMIPYINSVVLLPISVFYRSFTLEFLAQFDGDLVPAEAPAGPPSEDPPPPPPIEATA